MEKKALGKGLQALLPERKTLTWSVGQEVQEVPIDKIIPNRNQPRKVFGELEITELAESLKENGMLQPVIERRIGDGSYELIAGERRWRAAKLAGLSVIPALIRLSNDEKSLATALVENVQRENLNPMEEARAYSRLMTEFGLTQELVAKSVGKDRSSVANITRLVLLPQEIQNLVESGELTLGHAKVLASLQGSEDQLKIGRQIVQKQLSVRQVEQLVSGLKKRVRPRLVVSKQGVYQDTEERMRKRLGTKASIKKGHRGGQIIIHFFSDEELERILDLILD